MTVDEVRTRLAAHQDELRALGVERLQVFGSVARGEAGPDSDVDLLVDLSRSMGLFGFFALQERLSAILGCEVDLVQAEGLRPRVRDLVLKEAVHAA